MTLNTNEWARVTHFFTGVALPNGAAVQYSVRLTALAIIGTTMADNLHDEFATHILPNLSSGVTMSSTRLKQGPDATGAQIDHIESDTGGTATAGAAPNNAYLVHKLTAEGGRRGRGRMYLPGVVEANVGDGGNVSAAFVTALNGDLAAWATAVDAIAGIETLALEHEPPTEWVLVGGQPRRQPTGPAPDPTDITDLATDSQIGTVRRRNRS